MFEDVVAELCYRGVALADVWNLTRNQVRKVFFRERDKDGQLIPLQPPPEAPSYADQVRDLYLRRAWPQHKIEAMVRQLTER